MADQDLRNTESVGPTVYVCELCGAKRVERDNMQGCGHSPVVFGEYVGRRVSVTGHSQDPEGFDSALHAIRKEPEGAALRMLDLERELSEGRQQLQGAVAALRKLAEIHHATISGSRLHDPENRDWTECECKSCRLAQPYAEGQ